MSRAVRKSRHDYFTVLPDGGDSQNLPTWKTYCEYSFQYWLDFDSVSVLVASILFCCI